MPPLNTMQTLPKKKFYDLTKPPKKPKTQNGVEVIKKNIKQIWGK